MAHNHASTAVGVPMKHSQTPWPHFANMTIGLWLITTAFAVDARSTPLEVSEVASGTLWGRYIK